MLIKDILSPCSLLLLICVFSISDVKCVDDPTTTVNSTEAIPTTAAVIEATTATASVSTASAAENSTATPETGDNSTTSSPPESSSGADNSTSGSGPGDGTTQAPTLCHKCNGRDCNEQRTSANMTCESTNEVCWTVVDKSDSSNHTTNRTCDTPVGASCDSSDDCTCAGNIVACCCKGNNCNTKKSSELECKKSGSPGATSFSSAIITISLMVLSTYQVL